MVAPAPRRPVALGLYRDPALLPCVERPGFAGEPPGVVVELSLHSRLRRLMQAGDVPVSFRAPVLFAPTWRRTVPSLVALAEELLPQARGPVVLVCHTEDARYFVDALGPVTTTRLLWHPADRADHRLDELLGRVRTSALRPSVPPDALCLSSRGRSATAADWQRTVTCPVLGRLAHLGRERPACATASALAIGA